MPVVYVIIGAASQNHMHMSSSENCNMLSNAKGCPDCSKKLRRGVFQHAESLITPAIQALTSAMETAN